MARTPLAPTEVLLLGPGPSPVPFRVRAAMAAPTLGHLDPEFLALMDRVQDDLRVVLGTRNEFTVPISGTGSAGMEACVANLVEPGDRVVVGICGVFGMRLRDMVMRQGGEAVTVEAEWGRALDPAAIVAAVAEGPTKLVAFVHAETSTGVLQPVPEIAAAAKAAGALVLLDCVTSLGGVPVELDAWGIDAAYSGTQKCLSVPPGLAPVSFSAAALAAVRARRSPPTSWYLDAGLLGSYYGRERVYHHTAPIQMIYGLAAGLDEVLEEGLEGRFARHREVAQQLYDGAQQLGLELRVEPELRAPMLTAVRVPDGVNEAAARHRLRERWHIEIGGGLGPWQGRIWRIGLMGHGARPVSVRRVLAALADVLGLSGRKSG